MECVDIFTEKKEPWMQEYSCVKTAGPYGDYFTLKVPNEETTRVVRQCRKRHLKFRSYDERWGRSSDYRERFFRYSHGPYRCRYCGRPLSKQYMVIDHVIPVAKTKKYAKYRRMLMRRGIDNVNDVRNLVPACRRCNRKKGDKTGLWLLRARFPSRAKRPIGARGEKRCLRWVVFALIAVIVVLILFFHNKFVEQMVLSLRCLILF